MELKGSKTEKNLMEAFAGESMARNKYTYYASKAKKEGYEQIAAIFEETAGNEKEHAKMWFKELNGGAVPDTAANLLMPPRVKTTSGPKCTKTSPPKLKKKALQEQPPFFELVAKIENAHEDRYRKLIENLENGIVFEKTQEVVWICRNCGHLHVGKAAPVVCPTCDHPQAYFEVHCVNY